MAKKSRRVRSSRQRPRLSAAQMVQPGSSGPAGEAAATTPKLSDPGAPNLRSEYDYVTNDLKRIGIIAAAMLALLIVLAIVLI